MTIETKDVVAFSARLRTYQWGIEQDTLNQAADLIQSQSEHIAVLEGALERLVGAVPVVAAWGEHQLSDCNCPFCNARASLTKAD